MTDPDVVFASFVGANPVPDIADVDRPRPDVAEIMSGSPGRTGALDFTARALQRRAWAAAAALLFVLAVGALFLAWPNQRVSQPATQAPSPDQLLRQEAVSTVEEWLAALDAGDIGRVMALSAVGARTEADRRVHEWQVGLAAEGMALEVRGCGAVSVALSMVRVACDVSLGDLVAVELGVADLVAPFDYSDGLVTWRPYAGGDISEVNEAYASYLRLFHTAEYEARCSPAGYAPGTVVADRGLALTGECVELAAPLAAHVVQWINEGRSEGQQ